MNKDFSNLLSGAIANKQSADLNIRDRIIIRTEFKDLIPPLADDELAQLEENILKEGIRDPLIIWPQNDSFVLIDGHNRFSICKKHSLEFPFKKVVFKDDDEVRDWMIRNQLGRRNLTQEQQSYLRGLRYLQEKAQGKRSDLASGQNDQRSGTETTAERLGKEYNVSSKTIVRDGKFAKGIEVIAKKDPELKNKILTGKAHVSKGDIQSLGSNPENVNAILNEEPVIMEPVRKKHTAEEISQIAFDYVMNEVATPKSFYYNIGKDTENINPLEFFLTWHEHRIAKGEMKSDS